MDIWVLSGRILGFLMTAAMAVGATVPDRVEISGEAITVADLWVDAGTDRGDIVLGYAPNPGHYRWITRYELRNMLSRAGVDPAGLRIPERVLVSRSSGRLQEGLIEAAIAEYYRASYPGFEVEIESLEAPRNLLVPEGQVEVRVDGRGAPMRLDGVTLRVDLHVNGRFSRSHWARVKAKARGTVAVLRTALQYDQALNLGEVALENREIVDLEGCATQLDGLAGLVARRALEPGSVVRMKDFVQPVWVKAGEIVTLIAEGTAFSISAAARARQAGKQGDTILVQNLDSRQVVAATVVRPGEVRILLPGGR